MRYFKLLNGQLHDAALKPGPSGFMIANFPDGVVQTEVPNLRLRKRPAAHLIHPEEEKMNGLEEEGEEEEEKEQDSEKEQEKPSEVEGEEEEEKEHDLMVEPEIQDDNEHKAKPKQSFHLPAGWQVKIKIRKSGGQVGCSYKEYIGPDGRVFRSLREVQRLCDME